MPDSVAAAGRDRVAERRHLLAWSESVAVACAFIFAVAVSLSLYLSAHIIDEVQKNREAGYANRAVACAALRRDARPAACRDPRVLRHLGRP